MKELVDQIKAEYEVFEKNAEAQVEKGNKAAGARARKAALNIMKMMKDFRKVTVESSKKCIFLKLFKAIEGILTDAFFQFSPREGSRHGSFREGSRHGSFPIPVRRGRIPVPGPGRLNLFHTAQIRKAYAELHRECAYQDDSHSSGNLCEYM